jgi:aryl-alcohol dehydrogenase-like predicted oxidoreductase
MGKIGDSSLDVFGFCLGGNTLGWTTDQAQSDAVLDAFASAGGNFIDTADVYSAWVDGHQGGESEIVIGNWMQARGNRDQMIVATKVGSAGGLGSANVRERAEASLRRLQTDYIDLLYAHKDDPETSLEETLSAFGELVDEGKVRYVAASNYDADRLAEALAISARESLPRYQALQPHYNLVERRRYEGELSDLCASENVSCVPYYGLASGFLTGKYRPEAPTDTMRGNLSGARYLDKPRAVAVLEPLDEIAADHDVPVAAVALAWLEAQPTVVAPISSARTPEQLAELLVSLTVELSPDELARLSIGG